MTVVNQYSEQTRAYIDRGFLESQGIPAVVQADAMSEIFPAPGSGSGSIYLLVPDKDAEKAEQLLGQR